VTSTFDLDSNQVRVINARRVGNLSINFGVSGTFRSRLMGQHMTLRPWALGPNLGSHDACQWHGSSCFICVPSLKFVGFPFGRYDTLSHSALVALVTLTFDLETGVLYCTWGGQPSYQFRCSNAVNLTTTVMTVVWQLSCIRGTWEVRAWDKSSGSGLGSIATRGNFSSLSRALRVGSWDERTCGNLSEDDDRLPVGVL